MSISYATSVEPTTNTLSSSSSLYPFALLSLSLSSSLCVSLSLSLSVWLPVPPGTGSSTAACSHSSCASVRLPTRTRQSHPHRVMQRLSQDRAQDPRILTLFPNTVAYSLSLSLSLSLTHSLSRAFSLVTLAWCVRGVAPTKTHGTCPCLLPAAPAWSSTPLRHWSYDYMPPLTIAVVDPSRGRHPKGAVEVVA